MRRWIVLAASVAIALVGLGGATSVRPTQPATQGRWVIRDLGPCGSECGSSLAINEKGQVVGRGAKTAFLWQNGRMRDLGTLGGKWSEAVAINDRGQVIGQADTRRKDENGEVISRAFFWQNGKMRDLGALRGDTHSEAVAINERGQVAGCSSGDALEFDTAVVPCAIGTAVLWDSGKLRDLGALPGQPPGGDQRQGLGHRRERAAGRRVRGCRLAQRRHHRPGKAGRRLERAHRHQ